jgi:hypothetical protein
MDAALDGNRISAAPNLEATIVIPIALIKVSGAINPTFRKTTGYDRSGA